MGLSRCRCCFCCWLHAGQLAAVPRRRVMFVVRTMFDARFRGDCIVRLLMRTRVWLLLLLVGHGGGGLKDGSDCGCVCRSFAC